VNGAYRGRVGNPVTAGIKSARWLITLVGLVVAPPALLALDIDLQVTGTFPVRLGAAAVGVAAVGVAAIAAAGIRPGHLGSRKRREPRSHPADDVDLASSRLGWLAPK
jgi:hypothetical protein